MTAFSFEHPEIFLTGLLLLPALVLATFRSRAEMSKGGRTAALAIRLLLMCVCLLAVAAPVLSFTKTELVPALVYILQDASGSVAGDLAHVEKVGRDLRDAIGRGPQIRELQFAALPWKQSDAPADRTRTDIAAAINFANMQSLEASDVKVVVISDGRATHGDAVEAANRLALRGATVHTIPVGVHQSIATRVVRAEPPADARVGIAASAKVTIVSDKPVQARAQLVDPSGRVIDERVIPVQGQKTLVLHFTPKKEGTQFYSVRVDVVKSPTTVVVADTRPLSVFVNGPPRLLICDNFPSELQALCKAMEPLGVPIDLFSPEQWPKDLSAYAAIVISDWSGKELTDPQRAELRRFVEERGGGLVFIGGGNVVPAEWRQNSLAEILPVLLRDKSAQLVRKMADASVVYVVDRSGSMNEILGGATPVSKIDMVKAAIIASVQSLPEHTQIAVVSFDSQVEILVPPMDVSQKDEISRRVDTLSARGGTVIEPALREGMALLATMPGKKHLVALTDGIGEQPASNVGYWGAVADDAKKMHVSWTSIAVGADADQALLSYLAQETHGQFFFCDTGDKIPKVFLQQAEGIKKIQKQKEKSFHPAAGPAADRLKDVALVDMPDLEGHIRAAARERVDVLLVDDESAPLLASWQFGLGKVVSFMSDAKGGWAREWLAWKGYSPFWLQTVQDVMRATPALHASVTSHMAGNRAVFNFKVTDQEGRSVDSLKTTGAVSPAPSNAASARVATPPVVPVEWNQLGPGEFQASANVPGDGQNYLVSLSLAQNSHNETKYCAIVTGQADPEMAETGPDMTALQAIADAGRGVCSSDIAPIAEQCRDVRQREISRRSPLWQALVICALILFPLDIACRKFLK